MKMKEHVVEKIVYIKNEEHAKQVRIDAARKTEAIIGMLQRGLSFDEIAMNAGVTKGFVTSLANTLGLTPRRGQSGLFDFHNLNFAQAMSVPVKYLDLSEDIQYRVVEHDTKNKRVVLEYRE